jgi:hypothetical protein
LIFFRWKDAAAQVNVVIARSTCDEAIHSFLLRLYGLLRGACHRAALRAEPLARNDEEKDRIADPVLFFLLS